jgi:hypothetical protein|tara:strand:+ start:72 stop:302 length:231 start_codon:yes stop_codon:yes gene_type:complete
MVRKIPVNLTVRRKMNSSLKHIVSQLEDLTRHDISIDVGLDMLESSAKTLKDVITINVMRDSYNEVLKEERQCQTQ